MYDQQFYVLNKSNNQQIGPMSETEVRQWVSQQLLTNEDMIASVNNPNWGLIGQSPFAAPVSASYQSVNQHQFANHAQLQIQNAAPSVKPPVDSSLLVNRWLALLIDGACAIPFFFLAFIPIINLVMAPLLCAYFLSRDVLAGSGQSLGKKALGLRVVKSDDTPVLWADSAKRNIIYLVLLVMLVNIIPWFGWIITAIAFKLAFLTETIVVASSGRRIGDHLGTTYVTKA